MLERMSSKGNIPPLLMGMQTYITTLEISMAVSQKIGHQPTSRLLNTTLRPIPRRCSIILQGHLLNYVHSNIIWNSWKLETQMSLNQRMDKENVAHLYIEILLSIKNNDILKFPCKWMELGKKIILSEITQTQKDEHGMFSLICGYQV